MASVGCIWLRSRYFTSHPAIKLSNTGILRRILVWRSQSHMLMWVDFLNFLPSVNPSTVCMQIREDYDRDKTVPQNPLRLGEQLKVCHEELCVPGGRGPTLKCVNRFTRPSQRERKGRFVQRRIVVRGARSHMKEWLRFNRDSHSVIIAEEKETTEHWLNTEAESFVLPSHSSDLFVFFFALSWLMNKHDNERGCWAKV